MTAMAAASTVPPNDPVTANVPDALIENLYTGTVFEQYLASTVGILRSADRAGDGLDRRDVELAEARKLAEMRASAVQQMLVYDLNGDLKVTRDELVQLGQGSDDDRRRQSESMLERFDGDADGVITLAETAATASTPSNVMPLTAYLALDPDRDGKLTATELRMLAERAFRSVDRDGDGSISPSEYRAIEDRVQQVQRLRTMPRCDLPKPSDRATVVFYASYEGMTLSSVAIGGVQQETNLIDVAIEPGKTPLYVMLASHESMVWRLTGATDRVARIVVSSSQTGKRMAIKPPGGRAGGTVVPSTGQVAASGVIGLPRDRVTIAGGGCPAYSDSTDKAETKAALQSVQRALGRDPDVVLGSYAAYGVSLPSGTIDTARRGTVPPPPGFDAASWSDATRFWPGGLAIVDPHRVVADTRVDRYAVLPSQMGLSQLIGSGHIERTTSGAFRIVKPIAHMPPGMGGAHSVKLVVAKDVPVPPGDPIHSCVVREEVGIPITRGPRCGPTD